MSNKPASAAAVSDASARGTRVRLRWVLAHEPITAFEKAARVFADIVREESAGDMEIAVMTVRDFAPGRDLTPDDLIAAVASGDLDMCQNYSSSLGRLHAPLWALDLPFMFRDHDHATRVLDGAIGMGLLEGLAPHGLRGLCFTYSGGKRITATVERPLERLEDFAGLPIRIHENPVAKAVFDAVGAVPVPALLKDILPLAERGSISAAEITYARYWHLHHHKVYKAITETEHSLFLTAMVINEKTYRSLPEGHQRILSRAALKIASMERTSALQENERIKVEARGLGVKVVPFPQAESARFVRATLPVHERFAPEFGRELLAAIRAA